MAADEEQTRHTYQVYRELREFTDRLVIPG